MLPVPQSTEEPQSIKRVNINNSLSTLNPIHYEAMNTANLPVPAGTRSGPNLTMRDIVKWKQEEAFSLGEIGFHTNFPNPSDIFKPIKISTDPSDEAQSPTDINNDAAMKAAMLGLHRQITGLQQRKQVMDANKALVSKTELDVTRKLRAAGVPEERLGHETTLRQKVVNLVRLKFPEPEPNFITVYVEPSTSKGRSQTLEINLPLEASITEVYALLGEVVVAMLSSKGFTYERGGAWKYQLVDRSRCQLLLNESLPLETDSDYGGMLQRISRNGGQNAPVAVLMQEGSTVRSIDTEEAGGGGARARRESVSDEHEMLDEDDNVLDVLDEDGKPFFEPLDMDRVSRKYADFGEDLTEESGIHGFWR